MRWTGTRLGKRLAQGIQAAAFGLAVFLLARRLDRSTLHDAIALIERMGPRAMLTLVPFSLAMALDTLAQRRLLAALGQRVQLGILYLVRWAAEAASMALPAGAAFAETVTPLLLKQRAAVPYSATIVANGAKRWLTIRAQSAYLFLSVVIGASTLTKVSPALTGGRALPWITLAAALVALVGSWAIGAALLRKQWSSRIGDSLRALRDARRSRWSATLLLLGGWLLETVDTLVILRLLGARIGFAEVIAFEAGLAMVRNLAFFAPAGLGVQDLGYLAFLGALGLPGAASLGAAFVLVKRTKEVVCILLGGALFLGLRRESRPTALAAEVP